AVGVDAVETGDPVQAHEVPRPPRAPAHLDDEVGAAGEEAAVGAEARALLDRLGQRGRLVVLEAHPLPCGARARPSPPGGRTPGPKSRAVIIVQSSATGNRTPTARACGRYAGTPRSRRARPPGPCRGERAHARERGSRAGATGARRCRPDSRSAPAPVAPAPGRWRAGCPPSRGRGRARWAGCS